MDMRNIDRIRAMSVEEFAPLLVRTDYTIDEDSRWYQDVYISPDEKVHYFYEDAIESTIEWLNQEV